MSVSENPQGLLSSYRQLAPSASVRVSPLCLGAMTFGLTHSGQYGEMTKWTAFEIMNSFYDNGGNFIDTANAYHEGQSEQWLGEWMTERKIRDQIVLATKYTSPYSQDPKAIRANYNGNGTKSMRISLERSLQNLQTTYIDLFYVHFWDYTTSIPELMHALNDLVSSGKVNYLGISDAPRLGGYEGKSFVVYQGMWNAAMRDFERDIIPMAMDEGMGICPYGVLNQGRFQTAEGFEERKKQNPGRNFMPLSARDQQVSGKLEEVSEKTGHSLFNVALAYVMHKAPFVFPIVGARTTDHLKGNVPALAVRLSESDIAEIDSAYEFDHGFPHTFLSGTLFDGSKPKGAFGPQDVCLTRATNTRFEWVEGLKSISLQK
ncbi:NAD(P)-linked oxidoreductase [Penicillium frequentans]|uniref:NAD(P)-linked oxidoreductase n=1 Tax=Penicillium frequentans TaxID=3151616 RepID=A0AAD6CKP6_9EURO|nr:NAD(P)-linked oxidoreductase [Penicillium glabrum]